MLNQLNTLNKISKNLLSHVERWLLPYACISCNKLSDQTKDLCTSCEKKLPWVKHSCIQCGISFKHNALTSTDKICGQCQNTPPKFDFTVTAFEYQEQATILITQFKFKHQLAYGRVLSELLSEQIAKKISNLHLDSLPEAIIPVPLHWWKHSLRGYNQSAIIAKILSKKLSIPLDIRLVKRKKFTKSQRLLNTRARKQNIKNAFAVIHSEKNQQKLASYRHLAIVDDVVTTGSTVNQLANLLKKHGVKTISVWALARANCKA